MAPRRHPVGDWLALRRALCDALAGEGRLSPQAIGAIGAVPRHDFVPSRHRAHSYEDRPLPIGLGQTISQPFMVGWLCDAVGTAPGRRILEIGTGCGYQAAVLAAMGAEVWSVEIRSALAARARNVLDLLGYPRIRTRVGDGAVGWPEAAPFDGIIMTAAPRSIPPMLLPQLRPGGFLVAPVGPPEGIQDLIRLRRIPGGQALTEVLGQCRFVPMATPTELGNLRSPPSQPGVGGP